MYFEKQTSLTESSEPRKITIKMGWPSKLFAVYSEFKQNGLSLLRLRPYFYFILFYFC